MSAYGRTDSEPGKSRSKACRITAGSGREKASQLPDHHPSKRTCNVALLLARQSADEAPLGIGVAAHRGLDETPALFGQLHDDAAPVDLVRQAPDMARLLQPAQEVRKAARGE